MNVTHPSTSVSADPTVPAIHIRRLFHATPGQLLRAHTDPAIVVRWNGPEGYELRLDRWDARTGGEYRYAQVGPAGEFGYHGCFHAITERRIVQTFTFEGVPDSVALQTLMFDELGDGRTELHSVSLCTSFAERDQWLASGIEDGIGEFYDQIDDLVAAGAL